MRKISLVMLGAVLGASTVLVGTQTHLFFSGAANAAVSDTYKSLNLFGDVFEKIRSDYVEKPNEQKLIEAAVSGMLTSLDPHSSYMDAKSFRDMQVQTRGEFGGLGIEVTQEDGMVKVVTPIDDTPAARAGIMAGDIISQIDGESVQGMTLNQAVLHRDLDAEAAELAAGLHLHVAEALGVHIAGMRIKRCEHARDGRLNELLLIRLLDIVGADFFKHIAKEVEALIRVRDSRIGRP